MFTRYMSKIWLYWIALIILSPFYPISLPILLIMWYYWPRRGFWANQPMSSSKYGLIQSPASIPTPTSKLSSDELWRDLGLGDIDMLQEFLNQNYDRDLIISKQYLEWLLQNKKIIGITKVNDIGERRLIGTIGGFPITLDINEDIRSGYYVDLLCVAKEHRQSGYAVKLMEKMIAEWKAINGEIMLFKLDETSINASPDFQFHYYLLDRSKMPNDLVSISNDTLLIKRITAKNIDMAFQYFQQYMRRYTIKEQWTLQQFQELVLGNNILTESFLAIQDGKIVGLVNLMKNHYRLHGNDVAVIDIVYLLGNKILIMPLILQKFHQCQYFIMMDINDHQDIINLYSMERLYTTQYYLYNYELIGKYKKDAMGVNRF